MEGLRKFHVSFNIISIAYVCYLTLAGFMLCLYVDPEDGGDTFLRNIG
jgi:hypothetical protein